MSKRERFSRKSLKKPDEFLSVSRKAIRYFEENRNKVIVFAFVMTISILSIFGIRYYMQTHVEKMESLLSEMGNILKQDQPLKELEQYLEKFSEGSQKQRARLMLADVYFKNNNFDKAVNFYTDIASKASPGELSHDLAQSGLAYSFEGKKEYKKAIAAYKAIIERKSFSLPLFPIYMELIQNYELDNDKKNALLLAREMINKFKNVKELEMINQQINRLEVKAMPLGS